MTEYKPEHTFHQKVHGPKAPPEEPLAHIPILAPNEVPAKQKVAKKGLITSAAPEPLADETADLLLLLLDSGLKQTLAKKAASLLHSQGMTSEDMDEDFAEGYMNAGDADWGDLSAPERSLVKVKLSRWIAGRTKDKRS